MQLWLETNFSDKYGFKFPSELVTPKEKYNYLEAKKNLV